MWRIPGKVAERIIRHRSSITTEGRQVQARARVARQAEVLDDGVQPDLIDFPTANQA